MPRENTAASADAPALRPTDVAPRTERQCQLLKSIAFTGGWCIHHVPVFRGPDGISVGTPSAPQIDADGRVRTRDGKRQYSQIITFETSGALRDAEITP